MKKLYAAAIGLLLLTSCGHVDLSKNVFESSSGSGTASSRSTAETTSTITSTVTTMYYTQHRTSETDTLNNADDSVHKPYVALIRRVFSNEYCSDKNSVSIIDRNGKRYFTEDKNICKMNNQKINEMLAAGALDAYRTKCSDVDTEEIAAIYKLVCEAVENDDCRMRECEMLPSVEAPLVSVYFMCCNSDGTLRSVPIYVNKCMTPIFTNSDKLTKVYNWYNDLNKTL